MRAETVLAKYSAWSTAESLRLEDFRKSARQKFGAKFDDAVSHARHPSPV